jgi:hypothetical protein
MKESDLRKWHRRLGVVLALFVICQAGTGLLLSLEGLAPDPSHADSRHGTSHEESAWKETVESLHYGGGTGGAWYRLTLALGLAGMVGSGGMIFLKIRHRGRGRP